MKYPTAQEIVAKALFNLYGRSEPDAAIEAAAGQSLYDLLVRTQDSHDLFFCRQRQTFAISADKNDYSTADIFTIDNECRMGAIYKICIAKNSQMYELGVLSPDDYDVAALKTETGQPSYYSYKYTVEAYTDRRVYLYPTPNEALTGYIYYKRIYAPVLWTDDYSHPILDEMGDYLVSALTAELCILVNNADKYASFSRKASDAMTSMLVKSGNMFMQENGGIGVPKW